MASVRAAAAALLLLAAALVAPAAARDLLAEVDPHGPTAPPKMAPTCKLPRRDFDVVVVGGGFAGLTAARNLARQGAKVAVLEAQANLGGRSQRTWVTNRANAVVPCNLPVCKDKRWWWDLGGQWVGPSMKRFLAMAVEYKVNTYEAPQAKGMNRFIIGGKSLDVPQAVLEVERELTAAERAKFGPTGSRAVDEYQRVTLLLVKIIDAVKPFVTQPWKAPNAAALDSETWKQWVERQTPDKGGRDLLTWTFPLAELGGVNPAAVSMLETARVLATMTEGGSEDKLFYGAAGQFVERLEQDILAKGGFIATNSPARHIHQNATGVTVYSDSGVYTGKHVVVAMPPWLSGRITYSPALPARRNQLTQRAPMGTTIKMIAFYQTPFWRKSTTATNTIALAIAPGMQVDEVFDVSPPGGPGVLAGFLFNEAALSLEEKGAAVLQKTVLAAWASYMGDARIATSALNFVFMNWNEEQWTGGGYNGGVAPGFWTSYGPAFYKPQGRIHWAGTEYATFWMGFYEGAIATGEAAATRIGALLKAGTPVRTSLAPLRRPSARP